MNIFGHKRDSNDNILQALWELLEKLSIVTGNKNHSATTCERKFDGWSLSERNPEAIKAWMPLWKWFYYNYFQVQTDGWHHIPLTGKVLLVGSHNGGLASPDTSMFLYDWFSRFGYERLSYALMHPSAWQTPLLARPGSQVGAIMAHPKMARAALEKDAALLVYPGGAKDLFRPYTERNRIHLANNKAFIKLALIESVPIVPLISYGAHDTLIVLADLYSQIKYLQEWGFPLSLDSNTGVFPIFLGLPWSKVME